MGPRSATHRAFNGPHEELALEFLGSLGDGSLAQKQPEQIDLDLGTAHGFPFVLHFYGNECACGPACDVAGGTDADFDEITSLPF